MQRFLGLWFPEIAIDRLRRLGRLLMGERAAEKAPVLEEAAQVAPPRSQLRHPRQQGWHGELPVPAPRRAAAPPVVTVLAQKGALRLAAVDATARQLGLSPGQALADARAMHPGLRVFDAEPAAEQALLAHVADWCRRWTPLVALDGPDGLVLDVSGCTHLFRGEAALLAEVTQRLGAQGFTVAAGLAGTGPAAAAMARHCPGTIVPPGQESAAAASLPVEALRLGGDVATALRQAGLVRLGDLALRPRAPFAARFGPGLLDRLDALRGVCVPPLVPRLEMPAHVAERRFFEPIATEPQILEAAGVLARTLCGQLERHGEGLRRAGLELFRTDGQRRHLEVGTGRPLREPDGLVRLLGERLGRLADDLDPGFGFDVVRLSAYAVEPLAASQAALGAGDDTPVSDLVDRLVARLGPRQVLALAATDTHVPERASRLAEAQRLRPGRPAARAAALPLSIGATALALAEPPARPTRILERAEPVEAMAEVPDGPPLRFRWRRVLHEVIRAEGPERIAPEWWRGPATADLAGGTRDYFRVEDRAGRRFWLYREGLYGEGAHPSPEAPPRWFLQGFFA